jgi:hypothetical protein
MGKITTKERKKMEKCSKCGQIIKGKILDKEKTNNIFKTIIESIKKEELTDIAISRQWLPGFKYQGLFLFIPDNSDEIRELVDEYFYYKYLRENSNCVLSSFVKNINGKTKRCSVFKYSILEESSRKKTEKEIDSDW